MNPQIRWKFILILIVILICLYGLLGLPTFPTSLTQVKANLADRIKLGLDLKGGSHLVLQVQVDEAIGQRCDQAVDQLTKQVHEKNILVGDIRRVDDTHIEVDNVDPSTSGAFRDLIGTQFTDWASAPAAGVVNGYLLTMRPTVIADLRRDTMAQAAGDHHAPYQRARADRADDRAYWPRRQRNPGAAARRRRSEPRPGRDSSGRTT